VVLHELLEIEVGELVLLAELEKLSKLVVGVDLAAVLGVLKIVGADVSVNLLAHGSAGHLSARSLAEELGELVADAGGLHEARGLAVARRAPLLSAGLLSGLKLASDGLLESLEVVLEGGEEADELLELGAVLRHLRDEGGGLGSLYGGGSSVNDRSDDRGGVLRYLLGAGGLGGCGSGGGGDGRGNGGGNILSGSDHLQGCIQYNGSSF